MSATSDSEKSGREISKSKMFKRKNNQLKDSDFWYLNYYRAS